MFSRAYIFLMYNPIIHTFEKLSINLVFIFRLNNVGRFHKNRVGLNKYKSAKKYLNRNVGCIISKGVSR